MTPRKGVYLAKTSCLKNSKFHTDYCVKIGTFAPIYSQPTKIDRLAVLYTYSMALGNSRNIPYEKPFKIDTLKDLNKTYAY